MTIESISGNAWSARAAVHDALDNIKDESKVLVLWLDADNQLRVRTANVSNGDTCWMLTLELHRTLKDAV
jgi:hypothetical protein